MSAWSWDRPRKGWVVIDTEEERDELEERAWPTVFRDRQTRRKEAEQAEA
jgi:hypothetical protein